MRSFKPSEIFTVLLCEGAFPSVEKSQRKIYSLVYNFEEMVKIVDTALKGQKC